MDIKVPDSWLREYLETPAKPSQIAQYLSLCGPSVERVNKVGKDFVYEIEVTTNRVDSAGIFGIAREAAAILPRFNLSAKLIPPKVLSRHSFASSVDYLKVKIDHSLCQRFTAVLIKDVQIKPSPEWMVDRLRKVGVKVINNVVDISNYLMYGLGQPTHTFDYDKIKNSIMILRPAKKGEKIITLDGKSHTLPGGDIIIVDGSGRLIDLAGIMGGQNSAVDNTTKNVLLFVQHYNPTQIRKTVMSLAYRTDAATLFEKDLDPEGVTPTIQTGIELLEKLTGGKAEDKILDLYPYPYQVKKINITLDFIQTRLGINITKNELSKILLSLGFENKWSGGKLEVDVPSWRSNDVNISEDILEEVARLYGYHNLPSQIMPGIIPEPPEVTPFAYELKVKQLLKGWGAVEVYTSSLVPQNFIGKDIALKLKNPLGKEGEYLRISLEPSLLTAAKQNSRATNPFHLIEIANVYLPAQAGLPRKGDLPEEKMMLAGITAGFPFTQTKGLVEVLLAELNMEADFIPANNGAIIKQGKTVLGQLKVIDDARIYYEFDMATLRNLSKPFSTFHPIPKYPGQIEDLSAIFPSRSLVGKVIKAISALDPQIADFQLIDTYENSKTFRVVYQNPDKTLTDNEVAKIRGKVIKTLANKFGARIK